MNSDSKMRQKTAAVAAHQERGLAGMPLEVLERVASFLPIEGVEALAQVSRRMHDATRDARKRIDALGLTGRARVGDPRSPAAARYLYTKDAPDAETRFYFPTAQSGATEDFPHITRRSRTHLIPHLTDVASIRQTAMPNELPPGDYPTRHRYDADPQTRILSTAKLPTNQDLRRTATFAPVDARLGLGPDHYVAPRYKARVEAGDNGVPGPGLPVRLTRAQSTPGSNPQHWPGQTLSFETKRK